MTTFKIRFTAEIIILREIYKCSHCSLKIIKSFKLDGWVRNFKSFLKYKKSFDKFENAN